MVYKHRENESPAYTAVLFIMAFFSLFSLLFTLIYKDAKTKETAQLLRRYEVTNITDSTADILIVTDKKSDVNIMYKKNGDLTYQKIEDLNNNTTTTHTFKISSLSTDAEYFFYPVINNYPVKKNDNTYFSFTTPSSSTISDALPFYGTYHDNNGKALSGITVIAKILDQNEEVYNQSTQTKLNGEWILPMSKLFTKSNTPYFLKKDTKVRIEFLSSTPAFITTTFDEFKNESLAVKEGESLDFIAEEKRSMLDSVLGDQSIPFSLQYPKNTSIITATKPIIKGKSSPGDEITVIINSPEYYMSTTRADDKGVWSINLDKDLLPGLFVLYAKDNISGEEVSVRFTIAKSGEQVIGNSVEFTEANLGSVLGDNVIATPSATIIPTKILTPTPKLTSIITPTKVSSLPTPTITKATPTPTAIIYNKPPPPVSGSGVLTFLSTSMILIILGILFFTFS